MATLYIKNDYTDRVLMEKNAAVVKALKAIGLMAEKNSKMEITRKVYDQPISPSGYIRTGRLRNSISHAVDGNTVYLGTNVEYAPYVELGTSKSTGRPFIKPAIEDYIQEYREMFVQILKNA